MDRGMGKVYLAGGITGMTFNGANNWRDWAVRELAKDGIHGYSPLRGKDYLKAVNEKSGITAMQKTYDEFVMSTAKGINTRDHYDVATSDVVLVNLLGAKIVSIGTVMEIAWAFAYRKPLVLVMEKEGNIHEHPMIKDSVGFHVYTLEAGVDLVKTILLPYRDVPDEPETLEMKYGNEAERGIVSGLGDIPPEQRPNGASQVLTSLS
jgi:nucleoside 2-deoxyribosyltransferase